MFFSNLKTTNNWGKYYVLRKCDSHELNSHWQTLQKQRCPGRTSRANSHQNKIDGQAWSHRFSTSPLIQRWSLRLPKIVQQRLKIYSATWPSGQLGPRDLWKVPQMLYKECATTVRRFCKNCTQKILQEYKDGPEIKPEIIVLPKKVLWFDSDQKCSPKTSQIHFRYTLMWEPHGRQGPSNQGSLG